MVGKSERERAKEQAEEWWRQRGDPSPAKCDICLTSVAQGQGFLLKSDQVVESGSYVTMVSEQLGKQAVGTRTSDSLVQRALMPATAFSMRETATNRIKNTTTPWLICDECITRHFDDVVPTS